MNIFPAIFYAKIKIGDGALRSRRAACVFGGDEGDGTACVCRYLKRHIVVQNLRSCYFLQIGTRCYRGI